MHAFPRRFRAQRAPEIEETFRESAQAGDPAPYGIRAIGDVIVAGWQERARSRPPLRAYLKYRFYNERLDPQWHRWLLDDLAGWFVVRYAALFAGCLGLTFTVLYGVLGVAWQGSPLPYMIGWFAGGLVGSMFVRRRILKRNGFDPDTKLWKPPTAAAPPAAATQRHLRRAVPTLLGVAVALLVVAPFAAVTLLMPQHSIQSMTVGGFSTGRVVDHTEAIGWAAIAAGLIITTVTVALRRRIARRVLVTASSHDSSQVAISRGGLAAWTAPVLIVVTGITTSALPTAPLVVPAAFLAAAFTSPALFYLALAARHLEHHNATTVAVTMSAPTEPATATPD
ncbi:MAG: hypothetical protein AAGF73_14900 [Actinomycetota bacterium]